jgi:MHS family proline/betaine transporter-like MFS transporter
MQPAAHAPSRSRTIVAGVIGNVLEWYDFALFGFLTPFIAPQFFPAEKPLVSLLYTFGVFAIGFFMRPLGGLFFGHIGDRLGRKTALKWSVVLMAVPTTLVAVLPTYDQIGLAAPLLLTGIRMLQGLSVGGEFIGSMAFLGEHASDRRRGLLGSWVGFGGGLGNLLGCSVAALVTNLVPPRPLHEWGWRLPFLGGLAIGVVGLWLRRGVGETPTFEKVEQAGQREAVPVLAALRSERRALMLTVGLALIGTAGFYLLWVWVTTWLSKINQPPLPLPQALAINTAALTLMVLLTPLFGTLSDRLGRKVLIAGGCAALAALVYPLFGLLSKGSWTAALEGQLALAFLCAVVYGPGPAAFVELFPTRTRYSGIALAYNGTVALLGGTTPFLATWLIHVTGYNLAPSFYLLALAVLTGLAALSMTDRTGQPLS